jgi:hypothetical protein
MGYLLIAAFTLYAARGWRSRHSDVRQLARLAALMAAAIAVQMWWQL